MSDRSGLFIGWYEVDPGFLPEINQWHSVEHMPERFHLPGFVAAQRFRHLDRDNAYCVLYRTDGPEVFVSEAYLEVLNNPTPWTKRMMAGMLNVNRTLCRVELSIGQSGCGGYLATARPRRRGDMPAIDGAKLSQDLAGLLAQMPGFVRMEFAVADHKATGTETNEKKFRKKPDDMADWVLVVEGFPNADVCSEVLELALQGLQASGLVVADIETGFYRLDHAVF